MRASKTVPDKLTAVVGNSRFRSKKNTTLKRPLVFDRLHTHLFTNSVLIVIFTIIHSLLVSPTLSVLKGFEQKNVTCYEMWYLVLVINSSVFQIFQSNPEDIYNTCSQLDHSCHWSTSTIFLVVTLHKSFKTVKLLNWQFIYSSFPGLFCTVQCFHNRAFRDNMSWQYDYWNCASRELKPLLPHTHTHTHTHTQMHKHPRESPINMLWAPVRGLEEEHGYLLVVKSETVPGTIEPREPVMMCYNRLHQS